MIHVSFTPALVDKHVETQQDARLHTKIERERGRERLSGWVGRREKQTQGSYLNSCIK